MAETLYKDVQKGKYFKDRDDGGHYVIDVVPIGLDRYAVTYADYITTGMTPYWTSAYTQDAMAGDLNFTSFEPCGKVPPRCPFLVEKTDEKIEEKPMKKLAQKKVKHRKAFEYRVVCLPLDKFEIENEATFDEFGKDGWELVAVVLEPLSTQNKAQNVAYFKREKQ